MRALAFTFVVGCLIAGCSRKPKHPEVAVTVPAWQSLVCVVAGPDAHVVAAEGATEPARLVFRNGLGLAEPQALLAPSGKVITLGDRVPALADAAATSPYAWTDPQRARLAVQVIGEELARADAAKAKEYRTRAKELDARLAELDEQFKNTLPAGARVPVEARYFAERYGLGVDTERHLPAVTMPVQSCNAGYFTMMLAVADSAKK